MIKSNKLLEDFKMLLFDINKEYSPCSFCKHNIYKCNKDCPKYQEGKGMYDTNDKYYDINWTCMDWDYGTCNMLSNTPCNNCFDNNFSGWEYNYNEIEQEE